METAEGAEQILSQAGVHGGRQPALQARDHVGPVHHGQAPQQRPAVRRDAHVECGLRRIGGTQRRERPHRRVRHDRIGRTDLGDDLAHTGSIVRRDDLPEPFDEVSFRRSPSLHRGGNRSLSGNASPGQLPLGLEPTAMARGRFHGCQFDEFRLGRRAEVGQRLRRESSRRHANDVAHVRPFPLERRPLPARTVETAHAVDVGIGRPGHPDERSWLLHLLERGPLGPHAVPVEGPGAPVGGERCVVPLAEARLVDVGRAAAGPTAVVRQRRNALVGEVLVEARIAMIIEAGEVVEPHVPAAAVVGIVPGEHLERGADGDLEDVPRASRYDLQPAAVGPDPDDTSPPVREPAAIGALRLHEPEITAGDVEPAVDAEAEAVGGVVGRPLVEAERQVFHENLPVIGDAVAIRVEEDAQVRGVHEIEAIVVPHEPAW